MSARIEGWPWFVYDPAEGFQYFATEAEARAAAEVRLVEYRDDASGCGEWDDEVEELVWGRVHQSVVAMTTELKKPIRDQHGDVQTEAWECALVDVNMVPADRKRVTEPGRKL